MKHSATAIRPPGPLGRRHHLFLSLLLLLALPSVVQAQFLYTTNNGVITITRYTGPGGAVTIPTTIDGLPVTSIGNSAFDGIFGLPLSVTIPGSVTNIEEYAFHGCTSLASVTIPNSVTTIGSFAFAECSSLTNIVIPNGATSIEEFTFFGCVSLTSVMLPSGLTNIGTWAFLSCSSLTTITFPNSVTSIGAGAFGYCEALTNVTMGSGLASIGAAAFQGCSSLLAVTIPGSVTHIGDSAFSECNSLATITVDPLNSFYRSFEGVLFNADRNLLLQYPGGKTGSYAVPFRVTSIAEVAFAYCAGLTTVTIPDGVIAIGNNAFYSCPNLTGVYFHGNAPSAAPVLFQDSNNAICYYLPGTLGWATSFGGRPTAQWSLPQPVILTIPPHFGVQTNAFGFRISWATNVPVVVEACADLATPVWTPLSTNLLAPSGWFPFSDPEWTNYPSRIYRVRSQ